jgi:hypothetical protein
MTMTDTSTGWQLAAGNLRESVRAQFPARPLAAAWPATGWSRLEVSGRTSPACRSRRSFKASQDMRGRGLTRMLDWLEGQRGETWQERWLAGRAEDAGADWREVPVGWLAERRWLSQWLPIELAWALKMLISAWPYTATTSMNSLYWARIAAYLRRAEGATTAYGRGRNYENLFAYLMSSIPGCEVERNSLNHYGTEEADLSVSNMRLREGLPLLPECFLVECKNWSTPIDSTTLGYFVNVVVDRGCSLGVLAAAKGITGH